MSQNVYGAAYVKCLEKNMFTDTELSELVSQSVEEIYQHLGEHGYEGKDCFEMLSCEEKKTAEICVNLCESQEIMALMLAKTDFHNIKTLVKYAVTNRGGNRLLKAPTNVDYDAALEAFQKDSYDEILKNAKAVFDHSKKYGIEKCDRYADELLKGYIREKSKVSEFVLGWAELFTQMIEKKEGCIKDDTHKKSPSEIFKECDDGVTEYLKKAQFSFFSDDAVFAYFSGKNTEIQNLRLILCGKRYRDSEYIRERLRKSYV